MDAAKTKNDLTKKKVDMTQGSIPRRLLSFVIPTFMMFMIQSLYSMTDMAIVGHFIGSAGMSAVNVGGLVTNLVLAVINGLGNGSNIYMGQLIGARKIDNLSKIIGSMLTGFITLAVCFTVIILIFGRLILTALSTPPEALDHAVTYLSIYMLGTVFVYGYNALSNVYRALGRSVPILVFIVISVVLNIILDYLFVGPMNMGIAGAAVATVLSQLVCFAVSFAHIVHNGVFQPRLIYFKPDRNILKIIFKVGYPQALQFSLNTFSYLLISGFVNKYGVYAGAAAGAVTRITQFAVSGAHAFQAGMVTFTAQNIVQGKIKRIIRGLLFSLGISFVMSLLFWISGRLFPEAIFNLFTSDQHVIQYGTRFLQIMLAASLAESIMFCLYGTIAGSGHTLYVFFCTIVAATMVRILLVWLFESVTDLGFLGIAWAYVCAPCASGLAALIYILSGKWTKSPLMKSL